MFKSFREYSVSQQQAQNKYPFLDSVEEMVSACCNKTLPHFYSPLSLMSGKYILLVC